VKISWGDNPHGQGPTGCHTDASPMSPVPRNGTGSVLARSSGAVRLRIIHSHPTVLRRRDPRALNVYSEGTVRVRS
jgi:hypothetical protein